MVCHLWKNMSLFSSFMTNTISIQLNFLIPAFCTVSGYESLENCFGLFQTFIFQTVRTKTKRQRSVTRDVSTLLSRKYSLNLETIERQRSNQMLWDSGTKIIDINIRINDIHRVIQQEIFFRTYFSEYSCKQCLPYDLIYCIFFAA